MSEILLDVKNLCKYYPVSGGTLHAVDDVSFHINKGETLGLVGESGCGKSTIGRTVLRLSHTPRGRSITRGRTFSPAPRPGCGPCAGRSRSFSRTRIPAWTRERPSDRSFPSR